MLLHCCGCLILSVLGTGTLGITVINRTKVLFYFLHLLWWLLLQNDKHKELKGGGKMLGRGPKILQGKFGATHLKELDLNSIYCNCIALGNHLTF